MTSKDRKASLLYAQSWSMVFFLIHANKDRYHSAFHQYLNQIASRAPRERALTDAFEAKPMDLFFRQWQHFARTIKPNGLNTVLTRMEFLGESLRLLREKTQSRPNSLGTLRQQLQRVRFRTTRVQHTFLFHTSAKDKSNYSYRMANGAISRFQMLEPSNLNPPPRITAQGLRPQPTLVWSRDAEGKLTHTFTFR